MKKLPLTTNGKIDKKALPEPKNSDVLKNKYVKPLNKAQCLLCEIWENVLEVENIGIEDNFFDLGGHSLKLMSLKSSIYKHFNVEIGVSDLLNNLTIKQQSQLISDSLQKISQPTHINKTYFRATPEIENVFKNKTKNNILNDEYISGYIISKKKYDIEKISETYNKLIQKHHLLRTDFLNVNGDIFLNVQSSYNLPKIMVEKFNFTISKTQLLNVLSNIKVQFKTKGDIYLRIILIRFLDEDILIFLSHHGICDARAIELLKEDFIDFYNKLEKENNQYQFADYADWLYKNIIINNNNDLVRYWNNKLKNKNLHTKLPYNSYNKTSNTVCSCEKISINKTTLQLMEKTCNRNEISMFTFLIGLFALSISKWSNTETIIAQLQVLGRNNIIFERIVADLTNRAYFIVDIASDIKKDELFAIIKKSYQKF